MRTLSILNVAATAAKIALALPFYARNALEASRASTDGSVGVNYWLAEFAQAMHIAFEDRWLDETLDYHQSVEEAAYHAIEHIVKNGPCSGDEAFAAIQDKIK